MFTGAQRGADAPDTDGPRITKAGVVVALSPCVHCGLIVGIYGNGGGADLVAAGAVPVGTLRPSQARVLLAVLLARYREPARVTAELVRRTGSIAENPRPGPVIMGVNQRAQIRMTDDEIASFIERSRTATMATLGPDGMPHLIAMWYAVVDGQIWFETKLKSQKVVNLRRDDRITVLIEDGHTYDQLRGVSIEGTATISDDADDSHRVGVSVWERYNGPYSDDLKPAVEKLMHKRVAVRVDPKRMRSWDHRKLGLDPAALAGSTARYLGPDGA